MLASAQCYVNPDSVQATLVVCPWDIQLMDLMLGEMSSRRPGDYSESELSKTMILFLPT